MKKINKRKLKPNPNPKLRKKNSKKENKITLFDHFKKNCYTWIIVLLCIFLLSYPHTSWKNLLYSYITYFLLLLLSYIFHYLSHKMKNILTIIHHYHHENKNFLSYASQICIELCIGIFFLPFFIFLKNQPFNGWILVFYTLLYSSIHNINYGLFRVNDVHSKHHKHVFTNLGPDVCDILFSTKHKTDKNVENISHYIPNILLLTVFLCMIKVGFAYNEKFKKIVTLFTFYISLFIFLTCVFISIYLFYDKRNLNNFKITKDPQKKDII